jgi:RNA polymerase sigma-70 factor (ECF subfamily)
MGDQELIEALRRGQNSAWAELVEKYIRLVHHVVRNTLACYSRVRLDQDVEDIAHDLFQALVRDNYRVLGTIEAPYDLKAWLAISARRRAIDFARKRKLAAISLDQAREDNVALGATAPAASPGTDEAPPEEQNLAVHESLAILSAKERLVIQLFYLDGKKYREISRITGMNMNSISPTLARAVEKMQKYLTDRNLLSP